MIESYLEKESILSRYKTRLNEAAYRRLTKNALPYFTRGSDSISVSSQINGCHEVQIKKLFETASNRGYGDFLIDIGANIGLSSCQSGNLFKEVHCFEPNPNCFKILTVNTQIAVQSSKLHLYNIGLGATRTSAQLLVPKHNWGGAFVMDKNNAYSSGLLSEKDGLGAFNPENYHNLEIEIHAAVDVFKSLFQELLDRNLKKGVIKIDVEGYELLVLRALAQTLPKEVELVVVFECFDKGFDEKSLLEDFSGRAGLFQILRTPMKSMNWFMRLVEIISNAGYMYNIVPFDRGNTSSDALLIIGRG